MQRKHAGDVYETNLVHNNAEGSSTVELYRTANGTKGLVAKIVFWDAVGQFYLEMAGGELPLSIVEELIAESKDKIKIR